MNGLVQIHDENNILSSDNQQYNLDISRKSSFKEPHSPASLSPLSHSNCKYDDIPSSTSCYHSTESRPENILNCSDHASISSSNECTLSTHSSVTEKNGIPLHNDSSSSPLKNSRFSEVSNSVDKSETNDINDDNVGDIQLYTDKKIDSIIDASVQKPSHSMNKLKVSSSTSDNLSNGIVLQFSKTSIDNGGISSFSSLSSLVSTGTEPSLFTPSIGGEDVSVNNLCTDLDENVTTPYLQVNPVVKRFPTHNHSFHLPPNSEILSQGDNKDENAESSFKRSLTKISTLFSRKSKSSLTGSNSSLNSSNVISTTGLILQDRPEGLPTKSVEEIRKHEEEYKKIIESIKKRDLELQKCRHVAKEQQLEAEDRMHKLLQIWRKDVITNWSTARTSSKVRKLWWEGVPSAVRAQVWKLAIGNDLQIDKQLYDHCLKKMRSKMQQQAKNTQPNGAQNHHPSHESPGSELSTVNKVLPSIDPDCIYDAVSTNSDVMMRDRKQSCSTDRRLNRESSINIIKLDVSRTFPTLGMFQDGGPYYDSLHNLLGAYVCYRPDIGYIQGMSFIAAVLILTMSSVEDAFICFANILNKPCHHAFYSLDELLCDVYFKVFDKLFAYNLPRLHSHFADYRIEANLYLIDWIFTLFSRTLPMETSFRVWDLFCRDGEEALFRSALGLLKLYEEKLLSEKFDGMAEFLTGTMPEALRPNDLVTQTRLISMETDEFLNFNDLLTSEKAKATAIGSSGLPD